MFNLLLKLGDLLILLLGAVFGAFQLRYPAFQSVTFFLHAVELVRKISPFLGDLFRRLLLELCRSFGQPAVKLFGIDRNNNFIVRIDGKTVNTTKPSNIGKYTDIMVVKQGDNIKAYVNGAKEPIYELTDAHKNGGAFTFVNERSTALYSKYSITDTGVIGNPEASKAYKNWMK